MNCYHSMIKALYCTQNKVILEQP